MPYTPPPVLRLDQVTSFDNSKDKWARVCLYAGVVDVGLPRTIQTRRGETDMLEFKVMDQTSEGVAFPCTAWGSAVPSVVLGDSIRMKATVDAFQGRKKLSINFPADNFESTECEAAASFAEWWTANKTSVVKAPRKTIETLEEVMSEESEAEMLFCGVVVLDGFDEAVTGPTGRSRRPLSLSDHTCQNAPAMHFDATAADAIPGGAGGAARLLKLAPGQAKVNTFTTATGIIKKSLTLNGKLTFLSFESLENEPVPNAFVAWAKEVSGAAKADANLTLRAALETPLLDGAVKYVELDEAIVYDIEPSRSAAGSKDDPNSWSRTVVLLDESCVDGFSLKLRNDATECDIGVGDVVKVGKIKLSKDARGVVVGFLSSNLPKKQRDDKKNLKAVLTAKRKGEKRSRTLDLFGAASEEVVKKANIENTDKGIVLSKVEEVVGYSIGTRVFLPRAELIMLLGNLYIRGEIEEFLLKCPALNDNNGVGEKAFPMTVSISARVIHGNGLEADAEGVHVLDED